MPFDIKTLNKKFVATVALWINDLIDVIFPNVCTVCHRRLVKGENVICLHCLSDLPRTNLHKYRPNKIHERLMAIGMPVGKAHHFFTITVIHPMLDLSMTQSTATGLQSAELWQ